MHAIPPYSPALEVEIDNTIFRPTPLPIQSQGRILPLSSLTQISVARKKKGSNKEPNKY